MSDSIGYVQCKIIKDNNGEIMDYLFNNANKTFDKIIGINYNENLNDKISYVFPEIIDYIKNGIVGSKEIQCFSTYSNKWYSVKIINLIKEYFFIYFNQITKPKEDLYEKNHYEIILDNEINISLFNQVYDEDRQTVLAEYNKYLELNEFNIEYRIISEGNEIKWIHSKLLLINDQKVIVSEDITNRKTNYLSLIDKERILSAILYSTNELLTNCNYIEAIKTSLTIIGKALGLDQIKLFQLGENMFAKQLFIWSHDSVFNELIEFQMLEEYYDIINKGEIINELVKNSNMEAKTYLEHLENLSILMIPIQINKKLWGFISFEECKYERLISDDKLSLLKLFTSSIGKAIERKHEENEKEFLSYHDSLTGLYNRRYFDYQFKLIDKSHNLPISIIVADVNGLKLINDAFGHFTGDKILKEAADVFQTVCGPKSIIVRWGGDEFLILLPRTSSDSAKDIVKQIQEQSSKRHINTINLSISAAFDTKINNESDLTKILKNAEDMMYKQKLVESSSTRSKTVYAIIHALHEKNQREEQHSKRVSEVCLKIGVALNLSEMAISKLKAIGLLHDIGKIALSETILNKPGKLTTSEWNEIKRHSEIGYRILNSSNDLKEIAEYVLHHHERLDGTGYPSGLKGDEIPLFSRILAVADAYDAMTSVRTYRQPLSIKETINELIRNTCTHFDVNIVRVFIEKVLNEPMYKVIDGASQCFVVKGDRFNPLEDIFIHDETDPELSIKDLKIEGIVNEKINGMYKLIYSISNCHGELEKLERIVIVGKISMYPYNNSLIENNIVKLVKSQFDSAIFNIIDYNDQIIIELYSGGMYEWSSQIIFSGIKFEKGETYIVNFEAKADIVRNINLNIGWLEIREIENRKYNTDYIWHSFIEKQINVFNINPVKQNYTLEFKMEDETNNNTDLKFEFGKGEQNKILFDNIIVSKKVR
ncbi:MAG: diguanylate cyclase [Haloplasmataceae bacterium]|jgi:diguanylate cyclase (GGDEF)-like protein|nr:diguanylate cyclase [Haloplasmataceae bacterium]